jgi:HEAT repeat protein
MSIIALSGDIRALPILRKGMSSSNQFLRLFCAQGLAILQDKDSIKLIIDSANRLPRNERWVMGKYLLYFNDPVATAAGEETFTDKGLLEATKKEISADGPLKPSLQGHLPFGGFH